MWKTSSLHTPGNRTRMTATVFSITHPESPFFRKRQPDESVFRRTSRLLNAIQMRLNGIWRHDGKINRGEMYRKGMNQETATRERSYETFRKIDNDYGDMISRICYGYCRSAEELEDLRQDVYVNLWQGIEKFNGDSSLKTWVYRVALNTCVSSLRSRSRRCVTVPIDSLSDGAGGFDDSDERHELITMLYKCIDGLSPLDKAIVMMWLDGMSYDEIADTAGMTRNTVATRLRRAKEKIKNAFEI